MERSAAKGSNFDRRGVETTTRWAWRRAKTAAESPATRRTGTRSVATDEQGRQAARRGAAGQGLMISHVVLLKPRVGLRSDERAAFVAAFERALREVPSVRGVRVGRRVRHGAAYEAGAPDAADYIAIIDFDNLDGLQTYLRHPAHEEVGTRFGQLLSAAMVFDFEVGALDALGVGRFLQSE
jgi:stress responsive alpha/beta barrel protein